MAIYYDTETQKRYVRNTIIAIASVLLLSIVVPIAVASSRPEPDTEERPEDQISTTATSNDSNTHDGEDSSSTINTPAKSNNTEKTNTATIINAKLYTVISVTDGDTIRIDYDGVSTPLRLIGVDTPETVDQRTTVQCFGQEASDYLKTKLTGKQVAIESDPTQSDRDKYNRLLRYVYLNGEDVGLSIIANGYGHEYTYYIPYQKQSEYQAAEKSAASHNLGLWSPQTCAGVTR